ncbi:DoxX family protein [Corynebacterium bovis]|uniref:DoxX family protein n=1 Tax=Corynebacterium bovis TaxID=36808 RepID=UPI00244BB2D2|nr:DoxX family protein [Corynebacterium bovis]MDH2455725.1 DoxX family protein [Corynebacterium bovis]
MTVLRDIVLLISRILLGVILAAHGIQKWTDIGVGAVADQFATLGVPAPDISAPVVATAEILGGVAVILGVLTRLAGVLVVVLLAGAVWFAHRHAGIFVTDGGWELPVAIAAGFLLLAATGAGRVSVDALVTRRRTAAATAPAPAATPTTTSPATTPAAPTAGTTASTPTPTSPATTTPAAPAAGTVPSTPTDGEQRP